MAEISIWRFIDFWHLSCFLESWVRCWLIGMNAKQAGEVIQKQYSLLKRRVLDSNLVKQYRENPRSKWIGYGLLGIVVLLIPQFLGKYWNYAMGTVGIYVLMGLGLNIVVGLAGLLDLGYVAFFAIGAYTAGLLTAPAPLPSQIGFWPVLIFSIVYGCFCRNSPWYTCASHERRLPGDCYSWIWRDHPGFDPE